MKPITLRQETLTRHSHRPSDTRLLTTSAKVALREGLWAGIRARGGTMHLPICDSRSIQRRGASSLSQQRQSIRWLAVVWWPLTRSSNPICSTWARSRQQEIRRCGLWRRASHAMPSSQAKRRWTPRSPHLHTPWRITSVPVRASSKRG